MKTAAFLGPLEKKIMNVLWKKQESSVRNIWLELKKDQSVAYTTVLTVLSRLFTKGMVARKKEGKSFLYSSKENKAETVQSVIRGSLHKLIDNFGEEAVMAFVDEAAFL